MRFAASRQSLLQQTGLLRSLAIYYGNPRKRQRMARFYAQFMGAGDLAFDIGAHVGDRLQVWSRLGVRTVAVEPQPVCVSYLRRRYRHNRAVTLVEAAVGAQEGVAQMLISAATPTVSTLSQQWMSDVSRAQSFSAVRWESTAPVRVTTLDALIERYGEPVFCKIDVEGYELEALRGLSHALRALSIEFIPAASAIAVGCVERIEALAAYEFNWSLGERHRWESDAWVGPDEAAEWLRRLPVDGASGDIYARRRA